MPKFETKEPVDLFDRDNKGINASVLSRIEDLESVVNLRDENITKLVPSVDLEAVKRIVNQIVDILSRN